MKKIKPLTNEQIKSLQNGDRVFYCNQMATFNSVVDNSLSVVTIHSGIGQYDDYDVVDVTVIAQNKFLTNEKIDIEDFFTKAEDEANKKALQIINEGRKNLAECERKIRDLEKRISLTPHAERILDFLEGKFTHYVESYYSGPEIYEYQDLDLNDRWGRVEGQKLAVICGKWNGKERSLDYRLSEYSDGSGTNRTIYPFMSLDEAISKAVSLVRENMSREHFRGFCSSELENLIKLQSKWGCNDPFIEECIQLAIKNQNDSELQVISKNLDESNAKVSSFVPKSKESILESMNKRRR